MTTVADWIAALDERFPPSWAEEWDRVGLQVGDPQATADAALVALTPTPEVIAEAAARGAGILITHHPLLFRPLPRVVAGDPSSDMVREALAHDLAVFACHTNADVAMPGVTDALAAALDVEVTGVLRPTHAGDLVKLVTFVPVVATPKVLDAITGAGAGAIGEYSHCTFRVRGTGTFLPGERANPAIGTRGELTEIEEDRLEVIVPRVLLQPVARAMIDAHPYEEVAYDVYPLERGGGQGLGRIGRLREPIGIGDFTAFAERVLETDGRFTGAPEREIRTVALCGGSGAPLIPDAMRAGVDAYVTGDLKYHDLLDAAAAGFALIDLGHAGTERPFVGMLAEMLTRDQLGDVLTSEAPTEPFAQA